MGLLMYTFARSLSTVAMSSLNGVIDFHFVWCRDYINVVMLSNIFHGFPEKSIVDKLIKVIFEIIRVAASACLGEYTAQARLFV